MSGSTAKAGPEINLDEFERRLRVAGAPQSGAEDPLAELTRLVNMISKESNKNEAAAERPQARMPKAENFPVAANDAAGAPVPRFEANPGKAPDGAAERENGPPPPPRFDDAPAQSGAAQGLDFPEEDRAALLAAAGEAQARSGRSRSWYFKTVGLAAIGVALLGGAAALKIGVPGLPKTPPFIAAAQGPSKVQPPSDATVQSAGDSAALLMKDSATAAPVKVVSTEEQPVDLRTQTATPAPVAAASPPAAPAAASPVAPAAASPVAPAVNTPVVAPAEAPAAVPPLFPEAKRVKTVSVRPDGTLISADSTPTPTPTPAPAAKSATRALDAASPPAAPTAEPATPKLDLPTKLSPKSSARVVAKTDTTAPAGADTPSAPLQLGTPAPTPTPAHASKPTKTPGKPADADAANAAPAPAPAPSAATEPAGGGGDWAVQLAAPRSEADAQSAISRLKSKYSAELGAAELAVRKADVKGETIYRVRAAGFSKADAAALCAKLKASGGDCFIAKN